MDTFFFIIMLLTSVVGLTFIVERGLALRCAKVIPPAVADGAAACHKSAHRAVLRQLCEQHPSPLARLMLTAEEHLDMPREENEAALQTRARQEAIGLERGLVVLEIVVGIAPLMGLVGTIYGMMTLFGSLSESGLSDNSVLAHGISLILRFTMMGLLIAIPSLIAWSYYSKKVETLMVEMEGLCDEFIRRQCREQAKIETADKP
jgi:biopolymer transport protein ExbB